MDFRLLLNRRRAFFVAALAGLLILVLVVKLRSAPPLLPAQESAVLVDVIALQPRPIAPVVSGYGHITPKHIWKAVSEVSGRIVYRHPQLFKGQFLPAGTLLTSIDKTDYQIRLAQAQADQQAIEGQLAGKQLEQQNLALSLQIESHQLSLSEQEMARKQKLLQQKLVSQSELDKEQQNLLSQRQRVQDLKNRQTLLPNEIKVLQAQAAQAQARADEAERQLSKTDIYLPFDAQIATVEIENAQAVGTQQVLASAHGLEVMTVNAQVSLADMRVLMQSLGQRPEHDIGQRLNVEGLPITAEIELRGQNYQFRWPAKLTRVSDTVDRNQATVGVILEITQQVHGDTPRPPLFNGMFVTAHLTGQAQTHWVVPQRAVHQQRIYLMDAADQLQIVPVETLFSLDNQIAIQAPLTAGQRLVLNDLIPAVAGMKLRLQEGETQQ